MANVIGKIDCPACGEKASVQDAKAGALTIYCNGPEGCRSQTFVKSPKAVERLKAKLAGVAPEKKAEPTKDAEGRSIFPGL
jgi:hypothetical protein